MITPKDTLKLTKQDHEILAASQKEIDEALQERTSDTKFMSICPVWGTLMYAPSRKDHVLDGL